MKLKKTVTQFQRTQCVLYISSSPSFSADLLFFVHSLFICHQLLYLSLAVDPVPRPTGIIRFGNAENKSMLILIHMHTHAHSQNILDYANQWLMPPLKCTEWGRKRVAANINTRFRRRTRRTTFHDAHSAQPKCAVLIEWCNRQQRARHFID